MIAALRFGPQTGLPLAVRGGGHSFPGRSVCDGGLVVDLGALDGGSGDPEERTARAQAGVLLGRAGHGRRRRSGWPFPRGSSRTPGWRASRWGAGSAG